VSFALAAQAATDAERLGLLGAGVDARVWLTTLAAEYRPLEAIDLVTQVLPIARNACMPEAIWRLERNIGRAFGSLGNIRSSIERYQTALEVVQDITHQVPASYLHMYLEVPERSRLFRELNELRVAVEGES
jgi:hypothetical protein